MSHLGVDVVEVARFAVVPSDQLLRDELFTEREVLAAPRGDALPGYFAGIFAVKEALLKALGCGLSSGSRWLDISVLPPRTMVVSGPLGEIMKRSEISHIHFSSSRSGEFAVACVLLESAASH